MRLSTLFFCFSLLLPPLSIFGQKVLKMDTPRKFSKAAFLPPALLTFQIEGDDRSNSVWHDESIKEFDIDRQVIYFETWQIHVSQIIAIKLPRRPLGRKLAAKVFIFGASALLFAGGDALAGCTNCELAAAVGGGSMAVGGTLLWLLPKYKIYRIGKKNKLRLIDLTPKLEKKPV